jgi:putative aldouronate transport system substrate-binding protein
MKKIVSILLVLSMVSVLFAGCMQTEDTSSNGDDAAVNDVSSDEGGSEEVDEEPAEIVVTLMTLAPLDTSQSDAVEAAINEMTLEKINTKVDLIWYDAANYGTQVPMMIQANEKLDLMMFTPIPSASFASFKNQNQLLDIGDYLKEYAPIVVSELGTLVDATSTPEGILGITNQGPLANNVTITMRKDILEELGLVEKAENMTTWSEYEEILTVVTANTDLSGIINADAEGTVISPVPFMTGEEEFSNNFGYDQLGDSYYLVYADQETDTVMPYYSSDEFYNMISRAKDWYDKGLIYKDAAIAKDYATTLLKNEVGFSQVNAIEAGAQSGIESTVGKDLLFKAVAPSMLQTSSANKWGFSVPVTATEPEAAVKFLNLLHTDKEVINTLTWGIEGVDWVQNDEGLATYPEGVTNETVTYHIADFLYGNRFLITPWQGESVHIRDEQRRVNDEANVSKYMGFSVDTSNITTELTACFNVKEQYKANLVSGSVQDLDATYSEFVEKLNAAGYQAIIDEYQRQLDEWLAQW